MQFISVIKAEFSASLLQIQCHMILQKSFLYADLLLNIYIYDYYYQG